MGHGCPKLFLRSPQSPSARTMLKVNDSRSVIVLCLKADQSHNVNRLPICYCIKLKFEPTILKDGSNQSLCYVKLAIRAGCEINHRLNQIDWWKPSILDHGSSLASMHKPTMALTFGPQAQFDGRAHDCEIIVMANDDVYAKRLADTQAFSAMVKHQLVCAMSRTINGRLELTYN